MTREVLSNGVIVPEKYTRDWFDDFRTNLVKLNDAITAIAGKQNALTQEQLDAVNSAITSQKVTAYDDHIADTSKHLTDDTAPKAIGDEDGTNIKSGYVNRTTNQSIAGQKTFFDNTFFPSPVYHKNTTYEIGGIPASNVVTNIYLADKNNVYTSFVRSVIYASGRTATEIRAKNVFKNGVLDPTGADISSNLNVEVQPNGTKTIYWDGLIRNDVIPFTTNNNALGTSTSKWKTLNGVDPGALGMLNFESYINISSSITDTTGADNLYTATVDGYCSFVVYGTVTAMVFNSAGTAYYMGSQGLTVDGEGFSWVYVPVRKNFNVRVRVIGTVNLACFYPCLGNV